MSSSRTRVTTWSVNAVQSFIQLYIRNFFYLILMSAHWPRVIFSKSKLRAIIISCMDYGNRLLNKYPPILWC